jgi:restriction system protein
MKQAGTLASTRGGICRGTSRGQQVLMAPPDRITVRFLEQCPGCRPFASGENADDTSPNSGPLKPSVDPYEAAALRPDEQIRAGYQLLRANLAGQLWDRSTAGNPTLL